MNIPHIMQNLNDELDKLDPLIKTFNFNIPKNRDDMEPMDSLTESFIAKCNINDASQNNKINFTICGQ
jgi:hypothetical protein